jgi:hypothetical protein
MDPDGLTAYLQQLHAAADYPSTRAMGAATGVSHTQVHYYLRGTAGRARWDRVAALVAHLGGENAKARALWEQARSAPVGTHSTRQPLVVDVVGLLGEILAELRALRADLGQDGELHGE